MISVFLGTTLQFLLLLCFPYQVVSNRAIVTEEADLKSKIIQFSDDTMFYDLSQYNYLAGVNNTYEYSLQGRSSHQVYIYFYTKLANNAIVQVYDGDKNGQQYNLSNIDSNFASDSYKPPFVKSTTGSLFIKIIPFNQQSNATLQDFQALATDYENPAGCDYLLWACQKESFSTDYNFTGTTVQGASCINIIHATDISNNPVKTININNYGSNSANLYKGISMSKDSLLVTDVPLYVFDKHILLHHSGSLPVTTSWSNKGFTGVFLMSANTKSMLMTVDFFPPYDMTPYMNQQWWQSFTIVPVFQQYGAVISINQLRGTGTAYISVFDGTNQLLDQVTYTNTGKQPYVYEYRKPFAQIDVNYLNNLTSTDIYDVYNSGMYGTVQTTGTLNGAYSAMSLMISLLLIFLWNIW